MHTDAIVILKVARQMLMKHNRDAVCCAEMRAEDLHEEPRAAARWLLVASAINTLVAESLKPAA